MGIAWFLLQILAIFCYTNLHEFSEASRNVDEANENTPININSTTTTYSSISPSGSNLTHNSDDDEENVRDEKSATRSPLLKDAINDSNGYGNIRVIDNAESGPFIVRLYNEYIRDEMVAVFATTFMVFFMQTCLEVGLKFILNLIHFWFNTKTFILIIIDIIDAFY